MDYLRQIEEDIRGLGAEAKKKYPEVKDATERALVTLKTMREMYVADKMRKSETARTVKFPQSSDISAPYILACNYADANPKLLMMALSGIQMLVNYEVVPPGDVKNILRVFSIQAATGKSELQLKLLQILLQLANSLSQNATTSQYLTETTISSFLALALQLCDGRSSVSVSSTAFATVRQIIAIVMEGTCGAFRNIDADDASSSSSSSVVSPEKVSENFANSAQNLVREMCVFIVSKPGEWMRGFAVPPVIALDILDDVLHGWRDLFLTSPPFRALLKQNIYPALKPLLKSLQDDYANAVIKSGVVTASNFTSRVVRLARSFLLSFALPELMEELNVIVTLMIHSLQPDRSLALVDYAALSFGDESTSLIGGAGSLISRLNIPGLTKATGVSGSRGAGLGTGLQGVHLCLAKSHTHNAQTSPAQHQSNVLAHPAGACLEALLSFFSSDLFILLREENGAQLISSAITNSVLSLSAVICGGLAIESNAKEFDATVEGSQLLTLLEGLFSPGSDLSTAELVSRSVHEYLVASASITPADLLVLSFALMQVIVRLQVKMMLAALPHDSGGEFLGASTSDSSLTLFIAKEVLSGFRGAQDSSLLPQIRQMTPTTTMSIYDSIQESCTNLLLNVENTVIVRRSLGIMSELILVAGVCGLQHPCDSLISALCRFTVPSWHFQEVQPAPVDQSAAVEVKPFGWRHVQAMVRLFQLVHVLADVISDWDVIIDAIEQFIQYISSGKPLGDDVSSSEIEKLLAAIENFKQYTVYLSDDSLMKLMTSLVAMSLNNLTSVGQGRRTRASANGIGGGGDNKNSRGRVSESKGRAPLPTYLADGIASGTVSFSLQAAIEVTKCNSYRVSCVWQMVTSHLRMLATLKQSSTRQFAVAATHDMIVTSLEYMQSSVFPVKLFTQEGIEAGAKTSATAALSDEILFSEIMPAYDVSLKGCSAHQSLVASRMKSNNMMPQLSQSDLLSSLTFLASARHEDVQIDIIQGLLSMLQGGGEVVKGSGWNAIIALVGAVPESMKADVSIGEGVDLAANSSNGNDSDENKRWPVASLSSAFNCIKLVVDEFMDLVPVDAIVLVISCLASFSSQDQDVNISLTALEMLWKVYDQMMRNPKRDAAIAQAVFDVTMSSLLVSSMDQRPEIRHCSMNTLFAALTMTANASLTSGSQWKQVFDEVIFPLFQRAGDRSKHAAETNEEAIAPELKKGKKMTLHHSRDTAHKQWSETRVLALKGLARVIKTCTWLLLHEAWFRSTWSYALDVCSAASQAANVDQEVALAGLDVMFAMLKVISKSHHRPSKDSKSPVGSLSLDAAEAEAIIEMSRETLWQLTWTAVNESAKFECESPELALHICQNLSSLYLGGLDAEFKYSENIRILCETITTLARPRLSTRAENTNSLDFSNVRANKVAEVQLQRAVLELLRTVRPTDTVSLHSLISAYAEIAFASQYVQMTSPFSGTQIVLDMCSPKLRADVGDYIVGTILKEHKESSEEISYTELRGSHSVILDVLFRRFANDICDPAMSLRNETVDFAYEAVTAPTEDLDASKEEEGASSSGGFFSSLGKMLTQPTEELPSSSKVSKRKASLSGALHSLPIYIPTEKEDINTWTTFYPISNELNVLVAGLEVCSIHMSSNGQDDIPETLRQKIFSALLCILSPWRVHELPAARKSNGSVVTSDEKLTAKLIRLIDLIFARGRLFSGSNWIPNLVSVLTSSVRLQIHAVCKEAEFMEFGGQAPKLITCILKLWKKVAKVLARIVTEAGDDLSRMSALSGMLQICRDFSIGVLEEKYAVSEAIIQGCQVFLRAAFDVTSDLSILPREGFSSALKKPIEDELLTSWLSSVVPGSKSKEEKLSSKEQRRPVNGGTNPTLSEKAHLVLLAPIAFKLLTCKHGEIHELANAISSNVDLSGLVVSFTDLQARNAVLERDNELLRSEIHKLRSSQHLAF